MHRLIAAVILVALRSVTAHSLFTTFFINDVDQGDGTCVRMPMTPNNATDPINNLASNNMACGYGGSKGVARVCSVPQGAKLTFEWREWPDASQPGSIDRSHLGPCAVYMKAVTSAINDVGYGSGWFKIFESGYDASTNQWCTEKLIENNGLLSINMPSDLAAGYYLVRPELLALHQADKTPPDPQFYTGCAQVFLNTSGTSVPEDTVSIPGYVLTGDSSVTFNIYKPIYPYEMPGPAPYTSSKETTANPKTPVASFIIQTEGLEQIGCVLSNANWCGRELESYSTEGGCWNASAACWDQATTCYGNAPPTGSKNCLIWEAKCTGIHDACNARSFSGPPDKGKNLTPAIEAPVPIPGAAAYADGVSPETSPLVASLGSSSRPSTSNMMVLTKASKSATRIKVSTISTAISSTSIQGVYAASSVGPETVTQNTTITVIPISARLSSDTVYLVTNTFKSSTTATLSTAVATTFVSNFFKQSMTPIHSSSGTETGITNTYQSQSSTTSCRPAIGTLAISTNGTCGPDHQKTCQGSVFGNCCSQYGWCGNMTAYCSHGCKTGFGSCNGQYEKMHRKLAKPRHAHHHFHVR